MISLADYGYTHFFQTQAWDSPLLPARVTAVHKERFALVCEHGQAYGRLKSGVFYTDPAAVFPTTGDFVLVQYNPAGDSTICKTLERKTFFSRRDPTPGRGEQAVAANFDYVCILASLNHDFNLKRMERYLTLAWQSGAYPVVVLTKADLCADSAPPLRELRRIAPTVDAFALSAKTGEGLDSLRPYCAKGKTLVFLGSSGVGKSSLVNALAGEELMQINEIREDDSKGRHTTTHRQLLRLADGTLIIDTPGMRELGMWDVSVGLGESFGDVEDFFGQCKFTNCRHESEPGCAVKAAIESGQLPLQRWQAYQKLKGEAKYTDDKAAYMQSKRAWQKAIAEHVRNNPNIKK